MIDRNNVTLEMLENGKCKVGTGKDAVEVRVVMFCDLEKRALLNQTMNANFAHIQESV
jgi:hypothetical protein